MKKFVQFFLFVFFFAGVFFVRPQSIFATCGGLPDSACQWEYGTFCYNCNDPGYPTQQCCDTRLICRISAPGSPGGGCTCCDDTGTCYISGCGDGGGGGGGGTCGDGSCNGGETSTTCPTDCPPSNPVPIGNFDAANCSLSYGWTCDSSSFVTPLSVHFYADGAAGSGGTFIGASNAGLAGEAAIGPYCGGYTSHRFTFGTPTSLKNGAFHTIYAYPINVPTGNNPVLEGSPKTILCPSPTITPTPTRLPTHTPTPLPTATLTPTLTPTPGPLCPNGTCGSGENCVNCPSDCGACPTATPTAPPLCPNGTCGSGENCVNCPSDCGACPTATPGPLCPNGVCGFGENCVNCPSDCGACPTHSPTPTVTSTPTRIPTPTVTSTPTRIPTPTVTPTPTPIINSTITVQGGSIVSSSSPTCAQAAASTDYISNIISLTPGGGSAKSVAPGGQATWVMGAGTYTIGENAPPGYVLQLACWTTDIPSAQGNGLTADVDVNQSINWVLAYSDAVDWVQVEGGDVFASTTLSSLVAEGASPQHFILDGPGGGPGVVSNGGSYDFDPSVGGNGESFISSTGWHVSEAYDVTDWYQVMYHRFDSPTTEDYSGNATITSRPASRTDPYYASGNVTINGSDWTVGNGQNIIFLINGNLTVRNNLRITGTGFAAFIVKGDIIVDPCVGGLYSSSTPALEGVYITSPTGTFHSGASSCVNNERLVVHGSVIAGSMDLQRDLKDIVQNNNTSSEFFEYDPQLLVRMPDAMKDLSVTWEEVAP